MTYFGQAAEDLAQKAGYNGLVRHLRRRLKERDKVMGKMKGRLWICGLIISCMLGGCDGAVAEKREAQGSVGAVGQDTKVQGSDQTAELMGAEETLSA